MVAPIILLKGLFLIVLAFASAMGISTILKGGTAQDIISNETNQTNQTISGDPIKDVWELIKSSPNLLKDIIDMVWAGLTGVAQFFSKLILIGITYLLKFLTGMDVVLPNYVGILGFLIILGFLLMTQWENIWNFIHTNFTWFFILMFIVFLLGITLKMVGLV